MTVKIGSVLCKHCWNIALPSLSEENAAFAAWIACYCRGLSLYDLLVTNLKLAKPTRETDSTSEATSLEL